MLIGIKKGTTYNTQEQEDTTENHNLALKLLKYGKDKNVEKILESGNMELIYYFVITCLSYSTGKRKWNKFSHRKKMNEFVTYSDEAFALTVLENNAEKWLQGAKHPELKKHDEVPKAIYTEGGESGNLWSMHGQKRYVDLCTKCIQRRRAVSEEDKVQMVAIENMVLDKERTKQDGMSINTKRKRACDEDDDVVGITSGEERELNLYMASMSNGEGFPLNEVLLELTEN